MQGGLRLPENNDHVLIYNAAFWSNAKQFQGCDVVHSFFPEAQIWKDQGFDVGTDIKDDKKYGTILCALGKQKEASLFQIANALKHLNDNGLFIAVAANNAGGKRLEKWMNEFCLETTSLSKAKCRVVWAYKKSLDTDILEKYYQAGLPQKIQIEDQEFTTQAGIYGWNKIDQGSKILTRYLPEDIKGAGADFGCGYGFLADNVLRNNDAVQKLYVIDADYHALECAKENLKQHDCVEFIWSDLTQITGTVKNLDFIVMNPPFHEGKKADSDIGKKFVETAQQSLKLKGSLYMVANAHLPYKKTLNHYFNEVEKLTEESGFKVFKAIK